MIIINFYDIGSIEERKKQRLSRARHRDRPDARWKKRRRGLLLSGAQWKIAANRIFTETDDGIRTEALRAFKVSDPSLISYAPVRRFENHLIVTTATRPIPSEILYKDGKTFEQALQNPQL